MYATDSRVTEPRLSDEFDHICRAWDDALSHHDAPALIAMYAEDAVILSPLIPQLLNRPRAFCRGRNEIRSLYEKVVTRRPGLRRSPRTAYLTDGEHIVREYARELPEDERIECVEVLELRNGLIQSHRGAWF